MHYPPRGTKEFVHDERGRKDGPVGLVGWLSACQNGDRAQLHLITASVMPAAKAVSHSGEKKTTSFKYSLDPMDQLIHGITSEIQINDRIGVQFIFGRVT